MDINSFSYTPHMLDGEKECSNKTRLEMLNDKRSLILYYMINKVSLYQDAKLDDKNYIYDVIMAVLNKFDPNYP